jgi:hypothetical protein
MTLTADKSFEIKKVEILFIVKTCSKLFFLEDFFSTKSKQSSKNEKSWPKLFFNDKEFFFWKKSFFML